jgi:ADP-heptose:LPS heptosyltransferase
MSACMKILLWKIGALGDVVMTTPQVRQLRKALPHAQIDYLVGNSCTAILEGNPHLSRVIGFDERILFDARIGRLGEVLQALRGGYDVVFVLDKHWIFALLAWLARIPRRVGFSRRAHEGFLHHVKVPYGALKHEIRYYLELAAAQGHRVDMDDTALELPAGEPVALPTDYVVLVNSGGVNPNEQSDVRKMPPALFAGLVQALGDRHRVFLGTRSEHAYYEQFNAAGTTNLCGKTNLKQAWHVLAQARDVYTTDCGLMHMAGALNGSVTAVFGPTHPARKCPPAARHAWSDEAIYDSAYEVFGRLPAHDYFRGMSAADILAAATSPAMPPETNIPGR